MISQITKDPIKMNWHANTQDGYWKSYHSSFATNLTKFVGAQWVGENLGQIFCVYQSEQHYTLQAQTTVQPTLPVILVFHTITHVPSGGKWTHPKRGLRMCQSPKQEDCPFFVNLKPKIGNIYQEAESLKYQNSGTLPLPTE